MLGGVLSYWMLPLFSAVVWLAMILAMLIHWLSSGKPKYPSMRQSQSIAYISDVGAFEFKPLFITMGTISVVTFDLAFLAERWLRHSGRLVHNTTRWQKILAAGSIVFSLIGALGLILLTIFDVHRHKSLHDTFLALFIGGYVVSAVFTCAEYQRLGKVHRRFKILRASFWIKLFFIIVEVILAIAFGALNRTKHWNSAAIVEWVIATVYSTYVLSFVIDFLPAVKTKHHTSGQMQEEAASHSNGANGFASHNAAVNHGSGVRNNGAAYPSGRVTGEMLQNGVGSKEYAHRPAGALV